MELKKENIIKKIHDAGSDNIGMFGGKYQGGYCIQQSSSELADLIMFLVNYKDNYKNSIEIGVAAGGTTRFIREYIKFEKTIIVEDGKHPRFYMYEKNKIHFNSEVIDFIGNSHSKEAKEFLEKLNLKYDYVCIDGDHSYEGVKQDFYLIEPYMKKDTVVWFHDLFICDGVNKFCLELQDSNKYQKYYRIGDNKKAKSFGIGVLII